MSIRTKIISGYMLIILIIATFSTIAIKNYIKVTNTFEEFHDRNYAIVKMAAELTHRVRERQASIGNFLVTGKTRYLVPYDENVLPIRFLINKARDLSQGDGKYLALINRYEQILGDWESRFAEVGKEMRQRLDYGLVERASYVDSITALDRAGRPTLRTLADIENQFVSIAENDMETKASTAFNAARTARRILIIVAIGSLVVGITFGLFVTNHITQPLQVVSKAAVRISEGDLSQRIRINRKDETGILASTFNKMAEHIEENIQTLKESEEKYSTLVEKANDGIIIIQDGAYRFVNKKFSEITGYSVEELTGMEFTKIISPGSVDVVKKRHRDRMEGKDAPPIYETRVTRKNAEEILIEVNAGLIEFRGKPADLVVIRDVTERKKTQEEIKKAYQFLHNILESSTEYAIVATDLNLNVLCCNSAVKRLFDFTPDEIIGRNIREFHFHGEVGEDRIIKVMEQVFQRGKFEFEIPRQNNGEERFLYVVVTPMKKENGENSGLIIFSKDISEIKRREEDLKHLSERIIETQEEERKRISKELHDEIGQALSAININVEILEKEVLGQSQLKKLKDIKYIIDQSLEDIHRISYNLRPQILDELGLIPALRWYVDDFSKRTNILIKFDTEDDPPKLPPATDVMIYRIIQESLNNVYKHAHAEMAEISLYLNGGVINLTIEDNGKGFRPDKIFDGRGELGLGILGIKERLISFSGRMTIDSTPEKGTKLLINIPLRQ